MSENRRELPLAHELPYWDLEGDTMVLADGSLALGYTLSGLDIETWDAPRINQVALAARALLNSLPDGFEFTLTCDAEGSVRPLLDQHAALGAAASGPAAFVSRERAAQLYRESGARRLLSPVLYLVIYGRHRREAGTSGLRRYLPFFAAPTSFQEIKRSGFDATLHELRQNGEALLSSFAAMGVAASPMPRERIWEMIYRFLNPARAAEQPPPAPNHWHRSQEFLPIELARLPSLSLPSPREQLLFADLVQSYGSFFLDGYHHRLLTIKSLPEVTYAAMVSRLSDLGFPYQLSLHVKVPEQAKELSAIQAKRRMAHSMSLSSGGRASDLGSEAKLQSSEELLREILATGQKILYGQLTLLVRAKDLDTLDAVTKAALARIRELSGAEGMAETVAGLKVWKSVLPFGSTAMVRARRMKTDNLADFLPLYQPYSGGLSTRPVCVFRNRTNGLVRFDPFDQALPNYNTLVTGSSGAGKSFLNNQILLQYMCERPQVYIIDIGGSYRKMCEFFGGDYIEIAPTSTGAPTRTVNPLELPLGSLSPSPRKTKFLLSLLEIIMADEATGKLPKLERSLLEEAILTLYGSAVGRSPRLSDLMTTLAGSEYPSLRSLARLLYPWTGDRPYGQLFDAPSGLELTNDVVVFDLKGLSSYPDLQAAMILVITDFILDRVETTSGATKGQRKQILMDECWQLLKSPPAASFMEYAVRTLRKSGAGITFITQGLDEIIQSDIGSAIIANTATKFVLLQRGDLATVQSTLKLNDHELALISSLRQVKGEYSEAFMQAGDVRTVIRVAPTPVEYWLATSDAADNRLLSEWRADHPGSGLQECIEDLAKHFPYGAAKGGKT